MAIRVFQSAFAGGFFVGDIRYEFGPDGLFETSDAAIIAELEYLVKHNGHITEITEQSVSDSVGTPQEAVKSAAAKTVIR